MRMLFLLAGISLLVVQCTDAMKELAPPDCIACERIALFDNHRNALASEYWPGFGGDYWLAPLVYYSDSSCYIAFSDSNLYPIHSARILECPQGLKLYKLATRPDRIPFHMENKMSFADPSSSCFFRPVMHCSDVEGMVRTVPAFKTTGQWIQLVMHEYFHSYQFSHQPTLYYLADSVAVMDDSLTKLYQHLDWYRESVQRENQFLLRALSCPRDSVFAYLDSFLNQRTLRRSAFQRTQDYSIDRAEDFWEKNEGPARYAEYYLSFVLANSAPEASECDSLFKGFENFRVEHLETVPWMKERTEVMPAYYYVTGFNMCRLLDRLHADYKKELFDHPAISLTGLLMNERNH